MRLRLREEDLEGQALGVHLARFKAQEGRAQPIWHYSLS
jgi:hypothetical protein